MFRADSEWLTFDSEEPSVIVWKTVALEELRPAVIDLCGLGWTELYVNGKRVSEDRFVPVWSDYRERDFSTLLYPTADRMTHRTYVLQYDVTPFLRRGENVLCVLLGNGWYRQTRRVIEGRNAYGDSLLLRFELRSGGEVLAKSDASCKWTPSFVRDNNLFFGEEQDLALFRPDFAERVPESAESCRLSRGFDTELCRQDCPADRSVREIPVREVLRCGTRRVYRAEETVSGWAVVVSGGGDVRVRYADALTDAGELDFTYTGGGDQIAEDFFRNSSPGQVLEPRFTWHAFTYVETVGECSVRSVRVVHADVKPVVSFRCDNEVLNWLSDAFVRTQLNNMHCGVPSDCPHRERLGYTGDGQLVCETAMLFLDADKFYRKWIRDILDCQDIVSGHVQHTAPFYGGGGGPGGWGCAIVTVPLRHYERYGDIGVLKESFPHMERWVDSMETFSENGLVVREYSGGWCLGEWCTPGDLLLPEPFVNTYFYLKSLARLERICALLGRSPERFAALRRRGEEAFRREYFREADGSFLGSVQGADAFGLDLGLGDRRTEHLLKTRYREDPRFDTGIFGTDVLCDVLARLGETETLFRLLSGREFPSFGFMKDSGATTLWEDWDGRNSRNHPMFGACAKHLVRTFAGISRGPDGIVRLAPNLVSGIGRLCCSVDGPDGLIRILYEKQGDKVHISAESEREAELIFEGRRVRFSGKLEF